MLYDYACVLFSSVFQNPDLQTHGFSAATSLNSMVTLLRLWGTCISLSSSQSAILDSLATELKILGGSLTLLLHVGHQPLFLLMSAEKRPTLRFHS